MENLKIQKLIANLGVCSRRHAEILIKQKKVEINGKIAKIGDRATSNCKIKIDNQPIEIKKPPKKIYIILNKPTGFVSTMFDDKNRKTAADLIKHKTNSRVFIVGRLDLNSQGLMLFTNDGDLAQKIMHPSNNISKTYEVKINRKLNYDEIKKLENGIFLNNKKTAPAKIELINESSHKCTLLIELHEGKKRQIRKMIETLNSKVIQLKRLKIGPIYLGNLKLGQCRHLTTTEIMALKNLTKSKN